MPTVNVSELIDRAKVAADMEKSNFVSPTGWLYFANAEWKPFYTRVARMGCPLETSTVTVTATGADSYNITAPAAIISVKGESTSVAGKLYRVPMKSEMYQKYTTPRVGYPVEVIVIRTTGDLVTLRFNPKPASGSFYVKTIPVPSKLVLSSPGAGEASSISIPLGWDERVVLGMARRALSKEETTNSSLERQILEEDNRIENDAFSYMMAEANTVLDMDEVQEYNYANWYWI